MSKQYEWNQGRNDANSGKGPSNQTGKTWQDKESRDAGYNWQKSQSGNSGSGSGGSGGNK